MEKLNQQDDNLESAIEELGKLKEFIGNPEHILGNVQSKHGEIAENMQVYINNARNAIEGLSKEYSFEGVGRTAPEDYLKGTEAVQSKFYNNLRRTFFAQHAIADHMDSYPDFVSNGGSYDIPKEQYEQLVKLMELYNDSSKRSNLSDTEFNMISKINDFLNEKGLEIGKDIKPAVVEYNQAQLYAAEDTVKQEEEKIYKVDESKRKIASETAKPTLKDGAMVAGINAGIEGGVSFCLSMAKKRKDKKFSDFDASDWKDVGWDTSKGTIKGSIRGGAIYALTNFTATPANVASGYVTAVYGVLSQIKAFNKGSIDKEEFVINSETVCLDVTISVLSALLGQTAIPIPVLGAVIGNAVGEVLYEICKHYGSYKTERIIAENIRNIGSISENLDTQLNQLKKDIKVKMDRFMNFEQMAFDAEVNKSFIGSVKLAREIGVDENVLLKTKEDIDSFFLE